MKRNFFLLMLLFSATTMLFAQQLELKTISQGPVTIPKGFKWSNNFQIIDTVDNYLLCLKPITIAGFSMGNEVFLLAKDLSAVKTLALPQEYAKFTPLYLKKVGGNHFVKLHKGYKKYALALYDEHMNFVKAEPVEDLSLLCMDGDYIYFRSAPITSNMSVACNGDLIKMDKDMNSVLRKPLTVLWSYETQRPKYHVKDTLGHIVFNNRGTYMTIDKETLEQTKLGLTYPPTETERIYGSLPDYYMYEADKIIYLKYLGYSLSAHVCDYKGNLLYSNNQLLTLSDTQKSAIIYHKLDQNGDKVYILVNEAKNISIVEYDVASGSTRTVSSFNMEKNPGFRIDLKYNTQYNLTFSFWQYDENNYNLLVSTTESNFPEHTKEPNRYFTYIHLDKDFKPTKMEEEVFERLPSSSRVSCSEMNACKEYTLLMQTKPIDKSSSAVQFIIWNKFGEIKKITSDLKYPSLVETQVLYNSPKTYKISPTHYYILIGDDKNKYKLIELTVKS